VHLDKIKALLVMSSVTSSDVFALNQTALLAFHKWHKLMTGDSKKKIKTRRLTKLVGTAQKRSGKKFARNFI